MHACIWLSVEIAVSSADVLQYTYIPDLRITLSYVIFGIKHSMTSSRRDFRPPEMQGRSVFIRQGELDKRLAVCACSLR